MKTLDFGCASRSGGLNRFVPCWLLILGSREQSSMNVLCIRPWFNEYFWDRVFQEAHAEDEGSRGYDVDPSVMARFAGLDFVGVRLLVRK